MFNSVDLIEQAIRNGMGDRRVLSYAIVQKKHDEYLVKIRYEAKTPAQIFGVVESIVDSYGKEAVHLIMPSSGYDHTGARNCMYDYCARVFDHNLPNTINCSQVSDQEMQQIASLGPFIVTGYNLVQMGESLQFSVLRYSA